MKTKAIPITAPGHRVTILLRRMTLIFMVLVVLLTLYGCGRPAEIKEGSVRLAVSTELKDSGLLEELLPQFTYDTGWTVEVTAGKPESILTLAQQGEVDILILNSPEAERTFVEEGYSRKRTDLMFNIIKVNNTTVVNQYGVLAVDADQVEGINALGARDLDNWITSQKVKSLINKYEKSGSGDALFVPNAPAQLRTPT